MTPRAQSWREMSPAPRAFIAAVVVSGIGILVYSLLLHEWGEHPLKFTCYLVIALAASRLKVNLPGITGTMSVNFLFVLLGVLELSLSETMALGCAAVVVQCLGRDRPVPVQVAFNVCSTALAIASPFSSIAILCCIARIHPPMLLFPGGLRLFHRQHASDGSHHLADGTPLAAQDLVGMLLLEFPLLPGGRRRSRHDELAARLSRTGRPRCSRFRWCI